MSTPASSSRHAANAAALQRMRLVRPAWIGVRPAREALGLTGRTLLHAGPPLGDPASLPPPILSSAVLCCLLEGWAEDEAGAEALITSGQVTLRPAQDFGAVTPLAAVISPSSILVEVGDLRSGATRRAWSILGSGAGPQIRFGTRNPAVLERLKWRDEVLGPQLAQALKHAPLDLGIPAAAGLAQGDDLHARCNDATTALHAVLKSRLDALPAGREIDAMLATTPLFFLTLWMAACQLALATAADDGRDPAATLVVGFSGNGHDCGIRLAGDPKRWFTAPANAPAGPYLDPANTASACAMAGDSGAIDAAGFGAYALPDAAQDVRDALHPWTPDGWAAESRKHLLPAGHQPDYPLHWSALDAAAITSDASPARALIAMLDAEGRSGLLGRGVFTAPVAPFIAATAALTTEEHHHG